MALHRSAGLLTACFLLAGCAAAAPPTPSRSEYEHLQGAVAGSADVRDAVQAQCRADVQLKPADEQALIGAMLDIDPSAVPDQFCARLVAAIARGDMSYADFVAITEGSEEPQLLRRFLRSMRLDPSAVAI
jgi:hypothetical protein